jgi:hypothetical protein
LTIKSTKAKLLKDKRFDFKQSPERMFSDTSSFAGYDEPAMEATDLEFFESTVGSYKEGLKVPLITKRADTDATATNKDELIGDLYYDVS